MCGASSYCGITDLLPVVMRFLAEKSGVEHWWTVSEIKIRWLISSGSVCDGSLVSFD